MKSFLINLYWMVLLFVCNAQINAQEAPPSGLQMEVKTSSPSAILSISIHNNSTEPAKIFYESNSWGAAHWRVLIIRDGKLNTYFQNPNQEFTKNSPGYQSVAKGESAQETLNLNDGSWCGTTNQKVSLISGDQIAVIYDVPPTREGRKLGAWYGVAAAYTVTH